MGITLKPITYRPTGVIVYQIYEYIPAGTPVPELPTALIGVQLWEKDKAFAGLYNASDPNPQEFNYPDKVGGDILLDSVEVYIEDVRGKQRKLDSSEFVATQDNVILNPGLQIDSYTARKVYISYKQHRTDLVGKVIKIVSNDDFKKYIGDYVTYQNKLGYAAQLVWQYQVPFYIVPIEDEDFTDFADALGLLESQYVYNIVVLTDNDDIRNMVVNHVKNMSQPDVRMWRRAIFGYDVPKYLKKGDGIGDFYIDAGGNLILSDPEMDFEAIQMESGDAIYVDQIIYLESVTGTISNGSDQLVDSEQTFSAEMAGKWVEIKSGSEPGFYKILNVVDDHTLQLDHTFSHDETVAYAVTEYGPLAGKWIVAERIDPHTLKLNDPENKINTNFSDVVYTAGSDELTKVEQAEVLRMIGESYFDKRISVVVGNIVEDLEDGNVVLPAYMTAAAWAGYSSSAVPASHPLSMYTFMRKRMAYCGKIYFTKQKDEIERILSGGVNLMMYDEESNAVYSYHQLTTKYDNINEREESIIKAVDAYSYMVVNEFNPLIKRVVVDDELINKILPNIFLALNRRVTDPDRTNSYLFRNIIVKEIKQSEDCPDTVVAKVDIEPLYPFNRFEVYLYI